jgi:hypothetical protein
MRVVPGSGLDRPAIVQAALIQEIGKLNKDLKASPLPPDVLRKTKTKAVSPRSKSTANYYLRPVVMPGYSKTKNPTVIPEKSAAFNSGVPDGEAIQPASSVVDVAMRPSVY